MKLGLLGQLFTNASLGVKITVVAAGVVAIEGAAIVAIKQVSQIPSGAQGAAPQTVPQMDGGTGEVSGPLDQRDTPASTGTETDLQTQHEMQSSDATATVSGTRQEEETVSETTSSETQETSGWTEPTLITNLEDQVRAPLEVMERSSYQTSPD